MFGGIPTANISCHDGDITLPLWGLDPKEIRGITCIISAAANVSFNLPFDDAIRQNTLSTLEGLKLARELDALFVYISTAYTQSYMPNGSLLKEELPRVPPEAGSVIKKGNWSQFLEVDPERPLEGILPHKGKRVNFHELFLLMGYPNTYTMSKALAEHMIAEQTDVRSLILRPSIIIPAAFEPVPFLIDSNAGPNPIFLAIYHGLIGPFLYGDIPFDIVPVDYVADVCLVISGFHLETPVHGKIYHLTSGMGTPHLYPLYKQIVSNMSGNQNRVIPFRNRKMFQICEDLFLRGVKIFQPKALPLAQMAATKAADLHRFTTNGWIFSQKHFEAIPKTSQFLRFTNLNAFGWDTYIRCYGQALASKGRQLKSKL
ncbi:unnamed protein product [Sphagnum balticum]